MFKIVPILFILALNCCSKRLDNEADMLLLKELNLKYNQKCTLKIDNVYYLKVSMQNMKSLSKSDIVDIYKTFIFENYAKNIRRNTRIVYLNVYSDKKFQYQICYDPQRNNIAESNIEYHE